MDCEDARVRCRCGKCEVRFVGGGRTPRLRIDCCCIDCRRAALWSASHGGLACATVPCDLTYWPNDLELVRGDAADLQACALNGCFRSLRLCCRACSTNLLVDHPAYQHHVVMTYAEGLVGAALPPTAFRGDVRDLPDDLLPSLLPTSAPTISSDPASPTFEEGARLEAQLFGAAVDPPPTTDGMTFDQLLADVMRAQSQRPDCAAAATAAAAAAAAAAETPSHIQPPIRILDVARAHCDFVTAFVCGAPVAAPLLPVHLIVCRVPTSPARLTPRMCGCRCRVPMTRSGSSRQQRLPAERLGSTGRLRRAHAGERLAPVLHRRPAVTSAKPVRVELLWGGAVFPAAWCSRRE